MEIKLSSLAQEASIVAEKLSDAVPENTTTGVVVFAAMVFLHEAMELSAFLPPNLQELKEELGANIAATEWAMQMLEGKPPQ